MKYRFRSDTVRFGIIATELKDRSVMSKITVASILSVITVAAAIVSTQASAVSIVNRDTAPQKVQYAEGSETEMVEIAPGGEADVCEDGCKLTVNGKLMEVKGEEVLEIVGGVLQAVK